jgi:hypothetical protein
MLILILKLPSLFDYRRSSTAPQVKFDEESCCFTVAQRLGTEYDLHSKICHSRLRYIGGPIGMAPPVILQSFPGD